MDAMNNVDGKHLKRIQSWDELRIGMWVVTDPCPLCGGNHRARIECRTGDRFEAVPMPGCWDEPDLAYHRAITGVEAKAWGIDRATVAGGYLFMAEDA